MHVFEAAYELLNREENIQRSTRGKMGIRKVNPEECLDPMTVRHNFNFLCSKLGW
jgi:hypothetical protein